VTKQPKAVISAAYHEAGHAVAVERLGYPVLQATIRVSDDFAGAVTWDVPGHLPLTDRAVIAMAGEIAQRLRYGRLTTCEWLGCSQDAQNWRTLVEGLPAESAERALRHTRRETRRMLREHWADVESVAQALIERETLTGDEVRALLGLL
jgi:ATP-dependent Zn protease